MSNVFTLARVIKKCNKGSYAMNNQKNKSADYYIGSTAKAVLYTLGGILGAGIASVLAVLMFHLAPELAKLENPSGVISLYLMLVSVIMLIITIPMIMSSFFLSSDLESYIHMPIKPYELILAKLYTVVPTCYIITSVAVLPMLGGLTAGSGKGVLEYIEVVVVSLMFPIFPIILVALLSILFMHICKNVRKKENIVTGITYGISILTFGFYFFLNMMNNSSEDGVDYIAVANSINANAPWVNWIIPTNMLSAQAIIDSKAVSFLIYIGVCVVLCLLFAFVSGRFYIGSALGIGAGHSKPSKKSVQSAESFEVHSCQKALMKNEKNSLFRSTVYTINCFIWPILFPVFMIAAIVIPLINSGEIMESFFAGDIAGPQMTLFASLGCAFIAVLMAMMSKVTSISISKEGPGFFALRAMPVSYRTILRAKSRFGLFVNLIMALPLVLIGACFCVFFGKMDVMIIPFAVLIAVSFVSIINDFQLLLEARNPKLYWPSEEIVVKELRGRIGGLICLFVLMLYFAIGGLGVFILGINEYVLLGAMSVVTFAAAVPFHRFVINHGEKTLSKFE